MEIGGGAVAPLAIGGAAEPAPHGGRTMKDRETQGLNRRNFLRAAGGASTAAVAVTAASIVAGDAHAYDPGEEETKARYNPESEDVKAFYRVNGYETLNK